VPPELLVFENLSIPSKTGFTAIHAAAESGQLRKISNNRLTGELMMTRNDNGDTPLHAAAFEGHLDQVPAALLTRERLSTRNYDGISVAALAIERGFISQVPEHARPKSYGPFMRLLRRVSRARSPF
jgi:ankyrin repeat protein